MKRTFALILASMMMLAGTTVSAQVFSIGAGYVNSTQKVSAVSLERNVAMNGVYAGIDYTYEIGSGFSIVPGVYYEFLTAPAKNILPFNIIETVSDYVNLKLDEHYVNVPFMFNYKTQLSDNIKGFIYAGPTFCIGVSSKFKAELLGAKINVMDSYKHEVFNPFDMEVGGGLGLDIDDMLRFTVGYDFGCFNRYGAGANEAITINRNQFHVGVAYIF